MTEKKVSLAWLRITVLVLQSTYDSFQRMNSDRFWWSKASNYVQAVLFRLPASFWFKHVCLNYLNVRTCHCEAFNRLVEKSTIRCCLKALSHSGNRRGAELCVETGLGWSSTWIDEAKVKITSKQFYSHEDLFFIIKLGNM